MSDELIQHFQLRVSRAYGRYAAIRAGRVSGMQEDKASAMEAAKLLYHLHEHIPAAHKAANWEVIAVRFPDFALIRDVADADKHHDLRDQTRDIANAHQIEERLVVTFYRDAQGDYRHVEKRVFLKLTDGDRDVFELLTAVMNFWIGELTAWGYISGVKPYPKSPRPQPIPRAEADGRMHVQHMQGVPMTQVFMIQRYNDATGKIEPEDISSWNVEYSIRKLNMALDVVRANPETGESFTHTVQIPDDIAMLIRTMPPELLGPYLSSLPLIQEAFRESDEEIRRRTQALSPA
jgi:hypothetical protein